MTHDLECRRDGRPIIFANVMWRFVVSDEWVALGFEAPGDADVGAYQGCPSFRVETSRAQALGWLARDVQYELTGYEFVQWPVASFWPGVASGTGDVLDADLTRWGTRRSGCGQGRTASARRWLCQAS